MNNLWRDTLYSLRTMRKNPAFSIVAVLTLAVGIGANSAVFSVVNAVLLRELPYKDPGQLVMFWEDNSKMGLDQFPASYPNFVDYRDQSQSFQSFAAFNREDFILSGTGDPQRIAGAEVSENFFTLLGVAPLIGSDFSPEEYKAANAVMISHDLWQRHFGANPSIVGKPLTFNGKSFIVTGIMPSGFRFPGELFEKADLWVPLHDEPTQAADRASHSLFVIGRLKPQVPLSSARSDVATIANRLQTQYESSNAGWGAKLIPLQEQIVGDVRPSLLILLGAVGLVLLIACVNVANLLIARATTRQKEIAIRMAVGASRRRMIQQLLTESLVLGVVSSLLGLLLALCGIILLRPLIPVSYLNAEDIGLSGTVLGFALLISVVTAVIFGLVPAIQATKLDINGWLKEGSGRSSAGVRRRFLRQSLIVSEVTLSLVLLVGAGLLIKSFVRLQQVDPGFKADHLLTMSITIPDNKYPDAPRQRAFFQQALQQVQGIPGVKSAALVTKLPLGGSEKVRAFLIEGRPPLASGEQQTASYNVVSPDYFSTMMIPLVKGRVFNDRDDPNAPLVAVISQTMAHKFFPNEDPIGKRLILRRAAPVVAPEIIGVSGDVKGQGLDAEAKPGIFVPNTQAPALAMVLVIRSEANPLGLAAVARKALLDVDKDQPVENITTMEQVVSKSTAQQRLNTILLSIFAVIALVLAAVGIYSIMAQSVRQRRHEIGIRVSLGARPGQILKMVIGQGMFLTLIGAVIGLIGVFFLARILFSLLYQVNTLDPLIYGGTTLVLSVVAFIASYIPARRAMKVDPLRALRDA
jgi:putative ABC transport system permease protein